MSRRDEGSGGAHLQAHKWEVLSAYRSVISGRAEVCGEVAADRPMEKGQNTSGGPTHCPIPYKTHKVAFIGLLICRTFGLRKKIIPLQSDIRPFGANIELK